MSAAYLPTYVYLASYGDHCPAANFPGDSQSSLQLHAAPSPAHENDIRISSDIRISHGTRDGGMVFRANALEKRKTLFLEYHRKMKQKENGVAVIFCSRCFSKVI